MSWTKIYIDPPYTAPNTIETHTDAEIEAWTRGYVGYWSGHGYERVIIAVRN